MVLFRIFNDAQPIYFGAIAILVEYGYSVASQLNASYLLYNSLTIT